MNKTTECPDAATEIYHCDLCGETFETGPARSFIFCPNCGELVKGRTLMPERATERFHR